MRTALEDIEQGRIEIRADECKGCGLCIHVCPVHCLALQETLNRLGYTAATYLGHGCTGCSICFYVCPEPGVLTVLRQERPVPREGTVKEFPLKKGGDNQATGSRSRPGVVFRDGEGKSQ